ncbi:DUF1999 domain-containing protein [Deinococcus radiophilus]|uniref:DUF1999 domain-containing protein n=1 Tax=Deinococcus radiophilus TaxID=32062 RepID=A0A3S0IPH2_9DEIO|nr:DUF1999 domain-containing protein [Deinococcus radiophilus]RTR28618.1 DUF1999 domain-containing protein [Deinococcus radiophilus]UFA51040.1 DUF1999 domain-containing protein [Deinococcus radiophilus]
MTHEPQDALAAPAPVAAYRALNELDFEAVAALDLAAQLELDPDFAGLPEREREGRLSSSLGALKFYARTDHSFVAMRAGEVCGLVLAQSVWQGDKPIVLVRTLLTTPGLELPLRHDIYAGLLRALFKSAYDTAVYEIHFVPQPGWPLAGDLGDVRRVGDYAVRHLGSREETALPSLD